MKPNQNLGRALQDHCVKETTENIHHGSVLQHRVYKTRVLNIGGQDIPQLRGTQHKSCWHVKAPAQHNIQSVTQRGTSSYTVLPDAIFRPGIHKLQQTVSYSHNQARTDLVLYHIALQKVRHVLQTIVDYCCSDRMSVFSECRLGTPEPNTVHTEGKCEENEQPL